jgi:ribonuclease HII
MLEQQMPGIVAGIDEVGRGPLAGPVVAACVVLPALLAPEMAAMLDDSKRLSADQRGAALAALRASGALIGIGAASVLEIERLNILQASLLAMRRAFAHLTPRPDAALVDGNRDPGLGVPTRCVVAGDSLSLSIAAASIVAKQCRDRAMSRLDARYPGYGWAQNAGYGAPAHLAGLRSRGVTPHHRAGFGTQSQQHYQRNSADMPPMDLS